MSEQKNYNDMSESEKKKEDWMNAKWRPMMGWMYMVVCTCDFVVFPVLWSLVHTIMHTGQYTQWQPLTLQGAGLFHIAMGAVLGLAAWGRTQEKLGGANNGGLTTSPSGASTFGSASTSFGSGAPSFSAPAAAAPSFGSAPSFSGSKPSPTVGSLGKPMPVPQDDPVL